MKESDIRSQEALDTYIELVKRDSEVFFKNHLWQKVSCPACRSDDYAWEFNKNGFDYVSCASCRTLYAQTRPALEDINRFYAQSESSLYWIEHFFKPFIDKRRKNIFKPRAETISGLLKGKTVENIGDIGAGFGLFLQELRKLLPQASYTAIEPSIEQAELCREAGFGVECCMLEDVQGYENQFDLLTSFELFEHLYDPLDFLKDIFSLLKPGGYFFMTTLNGEGFDIQVLWERSKAITPPHHLNFFNVDSLSLALQRGGFRVIEIKTPERLDWDIVERMIKKDQVKADRFWRFFAEKGTDSAKSEFQKWLAEYKLSSHMSVLAQKPEIL